jgi:membrane protein implicated in regulation of membrane protease activity
MKMTFYATTLPGYFVYHASTSEQIFYTLTTKSMARITVWRFIFRVSAVALALNYYEWKWCLHIVAILVFLSCLYSRAEIDYYTRQANDVERQIKAVDKEQFAKIFKTGVYLVLVGGFIWFCWALISGAYSFGYASFTYGLLTLLMQLGHKHAVRIARQWECPIIYR